MASRNRGRPKPKLSDLSRTPPSPEELKALSSDFYNAAHTAYPTAAAILGAVVVEQELETLLRRRLVKRDDVLWSELVAENGPLSTFYRKIVMGRALRLYGADVTTNLHIVRNVRNAFAHAKRLIDFTHPLIEAEIRSTAIPKTRKKAHQRIKNLQPTPRQAYLALCHQLSIAFIDQDTKALKASNRHFDKKRQRPYSNVLWALMNSQPQDPGSNPPSPQGDQSGDPNSLAQQAPLRGGLFGLGLEQLRKEDKGT
jgi:hypothetical protein